MMGGVLLIGVTMVTLPVKYVYANEMTCNRPFFYTHAALGYHFR